MFLLLVSKRTRCESSVRAGVGFITRRVGAPSHTQSTAHGEDRLITVGSRCKTIRTSTGRCAGDRKRGKCRSAYKGCGDVIGDHPPLGGIWEPGERHGSSNLCIRTPRDSAIL
jgi:hypothetical protein